MLMTARENWLGKTPVTTFDGRKSGTWSKGHSGLVVVVLQTMLLAFRAGFLMCTQCMP